MGAPSSGVHLCGAFRVSTGPSPKDLFPCIMRRAASTKNQTCPQRSPLFAPEFIRIKDLSELDPDDRVLASVSAANMEEMFGVGEELGPHRAIVGRDEVIPIPQGPSNKHAIGQRSRGNFGGGESEFKGLCKMAIPRSLWTFNFSF